MVPGLKYPTMAAAYGDRLYVANEQHLACWQSGKLRMYPIAGLGEKITSLLPFNGSANPRLVLSGPQTSIATLSASEPAHVLSRVRLPDGLDLISE